MGGATRRLVLADRRARRPGRSATATRGPRYRGALSWSTLNVDSVLHAFCDVPAITTITIFSKCYILGQTNSSSSQISVFDLPKCRRAPDITICRREGSSPHTRTHRCVDAIWSLPVDEARRVPPRHFRPSVCPSVCLSHRWAVWNR